jgi:hypothetical protein
MYKPYISMMSMLAPVRSRMPATMGETSGQNYMQLQNYVQNYV